MHPSEMRNFTIRAFFNPDWNRIELRGFHVQEESHLVPVESEKHEEYALVDPFLVLTNEQAQRLMDQLWDCGIRPTSGQGSVGQLAAVQEHLTDMRTIAMHKLGIPMKEETTR